MKSNILGENVSDHYLIEHSTLRICDLLETAVAEFPEELMIVIVTPHYHLLLSSALQSLLKSRIIIQYCLKEDQVASIFKGPVCSANEILLVFKIKIAKTPDTDDAVIFFQRPKEVLNLNHIFLYFDRNLSS